MEGPVLAIAQEARHTRAVVYSKDGRILSSATDAVRRLDRAPGWFTHDPEEIWASVIATSRTALVRARVDPGQLAAIGIANQPDAIVAWDRLDGKTVHEIIGADDRRSAGKTQLLRQLGVETVVRDRTGMPLDPCRAATKF